MEGQFVSALLTAIRQIGRVSEAARAEFQELFQQNRHTAETEYEQARELTRAVNAALNQARSAQILLQLEQENLVARMIKETLPLFAQHMKEVLVIREQRWNRDQARRRYALAGAVVLGVFLAGYGLRTWADWGDAGVTDRCLAHMVQANGHVFCDFTAAGIGQP